LTLENKTDAIAMPLIEEKTGFGFALVRTNVAPVARNVSRYGRNETATLATPLHKRPGYGVDH
jgi:hypothetical protein